jgi:tRNA (cmo5U34)-methyltransferase
MSYTKPDDPCHWLTSWRVRQYLNRANNIPHRSDGEQILLDFIPKSTRRILDLGAGDGRLIKLLRRKIPNIKCIAMDFSPHMLKILRRLYEADNSVSIVEHDFGSQLPELGFFDAIVSSLAIHHLRDHRKKVLYSEIHSMLRPGGIFCNLDHVASSSVILSQHFRKRMGSQKPVNRVHEERLSSIEAQIYWLTEIGFVDTDCYWKWLQFALLIGFKPNKQK